MDAAISIQAVNDRPVVRAARLETVSVSSKGDVQTTGDGLSLIAVDVNDDALVTTEDEPLSLSDLFTVRDVDTTAALEIVITTSNGRSSFAKDVSEVVFLEPSSNASTIMARGASHIKFLSTEDKANALLASLVFTPKRDWHGRASITVACNDRGVGGLGGPLSHSQAVKIRVRKANDAPVVTAPELGGGYALYLDQGGRGKLEGASHEEAGRFYRQTQWTPEEASAYVYDDDVIEYHYPATLDRRVGVHPASSTVASESDSEESSRSTRTGGAAAAGAPAAPRVRLARDGFAVATAPRCRASTSRVTSACAPAGAPHRAHTRWATRFHAQTPSSMLPSARARGLTDRGAPRFCTYAGQSVAAQPPRITPRQSMSYAVSFSTRRRVASASWAAAAASFTSRRRRARSAASAARARSRCARQPRFWHAGEQKNEATRPVRAERAV